ncbi:MAG: hypothetical protein JXP72_08465 [Coriobacteriia bacterium]|nr:hypothetical protein [Coriobacteriia bacterium]
METAEWIVVLVGWAAAAAILAIGATDPEHPARRTLRWNPRLGAVTMSALLGAYILGSVRGDLSAVVIYASGLFWWLIVGIPIAGAIHLWRTRGIWRAPGVSADAVKSEQAEDLEGSASAPDGDDHR